VNLFCITKSYYKEKKKKLLKSLTIFLIKIIHLFWTLIIVIFDIFLKSFLVCLLKPFFVSAKMSGIDRKLG